MEEKDELLMTEVKTSNKKEKAKKEGILSRWRKKEHDFLDYLIVEVGLATAVLAVMLAINLFSGEGEISEVFSRLSATFSSMIV